MSNYELITIREIEELYGISSTKLKTIRSQRNNFNFPAPVENENPRDQVRKYRFDQVEQFFKENNIKKIKCHDNKGVRNRLSVLLAFYNRNSCRLPGSGGGETITVKIRPAEEQWSNEHQRNCFGKSCGISFIYEQGI